MQEYRNLHGLIRTGVSLYGDRWMVTILRNHLDVKVPNHLDVERLQVSDYFVGMSMASARKAAERLCSRIEQEILTTAATSIVAAPRTRDIATIHRRLFAADMLIRTGSSATAMRHLHYVLRNATYPEHGPLRTFTAAMAMLEASYAGNTSGLRKYTDLMMRYHEEAGHYNKVQAITCELREFATRKSTRSSRTGFEKALGRAAEIVAQRTSSFPDSVVIEIARLAALYCQCANDYRHGIRWITAQEKAYKRLGIWNTSTKRENFLLRLNVEIELTNFSSAIATARQLLELVKSGSTPWFNIVDSLSGLLIRNGAYAQAQTLVMMGFGNSNFRRIHSTIRRRLVFKAGYLAVFTNSASLWSTYERRRRMERDTSLKTMHHRVIDVLRMLQRRDPNVVEATEHLALQLSRLPVDERPDAVQQLINIVRSAYATRATRKVRASMSDSTAYLDEVVPWSVVVEFATSCTAPNVPTPQATRSRRASTRRQASATS